MRMERQVLFWVAALALAIAAIGLLRDILLPFIIGMIIAYALNPIVDRLMKLGMSRTAASATMLTLGVSVLVILLVNLAPILMQQTQKLALALPDQLKQLRAVIDATAREHLGPRFPQFQVALDQITKSLSDNFANIASVAATSLWGQLRSLFNFVSLLLVTPLVAFYMLVDWYPMLDKIDGWLPRDHAATIRRLAGEINGAVAAFIRGQGVVCLILAFFYAASLSATGLEYGLLVGIATGILSFVPFVGWALGLLTALALAVVQFWPNATSVAMVAGVFVVGQALDAAVLSPRIVGSRIGLHPVWLLFALFVFSYLFGFVGVLVAVPVAAAVAVLVRFALQLYLASDVYTGKGAPR
jgi:predicted PurR-regulated permease PerM